MSSKFSQMRPLVSMATDRVTVGKSVLSHFLKRFDRIHFILEGNDDIHKSLNEFEIWRDPTWTAELAALECLKKNPIDL